MTISDFDKAYLNPQGLAESLGAEALPDISHLTKLANELFSALPCDGSRLNAASTAIPVGLASHLPGANKIGLSGSTPQGVGLPGEAEVRHFFASQKPSFESIPNHLNTDSGYGKPPSSGIANDLASSLSGLDASVLAGIFPHDYGLPGEAELQRLLVSSPPSESPLPGTIDTRSISTIPSTGPVQQLSGELAPATEKSVATGVSPQTSESEVQKLFAGANAATGKIPKSASSAKSSIPDYPSPVDIPELSNLRGNFDPSWVAGLSPQTYGLPGEAELQQLFAAYSQPPGRAPTSSGSVSGFYFLDEAKAAGLNAPALGSAHPPFDVQAVRRDFPILQERVNGHQLAWLDNAATTQKPQVVIDRLSYFYEHENSNIHRAAHELAARSTDAYEGARDTVARFINADSSSEIIFVRGSTEAINLVAQSWGRQSVNEGDEIIISWLEHHANIVPWQQLCAETGAILKVIPVDDDGQVLLAEYQKLLSSHTKLVSFTHVSNALGTITPAQEMIAMARRVGARVLLDGAQSVSHLGVDVQSLDCDWFVFSGHKIFGPTGIGVLYGKTELLETMQPWQGGGNMIDDVTFEQTTYQPAPAKFEAGTGNIADAVGLGAALEYLSRIGISNVARYEHELLHYATEGLRSVPGLRLIGTAKEKTSVLSFVLLGHSTEEIGSALNQAGIAVRSGHHCAQPILRRYGLESTVRPSIAFYNTYEEIDRLVNVVRQLGHKNHRLHSK
ncbi:putative cysteine desulfurase 1 [Methyloglobulus morosus KoM1]|uniref:cysteine desulfurase n=1 Tax=Methyloglobulus morosus KoM1 TaxID=1116472 RepID=V5BRB8_9GAMM|nr:family 2A encapsulin nanocompartment cargo protein cysteine desulfurase [Methyloglobulus morosus]ESS68707.1 putative cysteine desulfurase 1 [Methyloglobulus morosus KoM1]